MPNPVPLTPPEGFAARLSEIGVHVDAPALAQLGDYLARLLAMNEQMNLTAIEDPALAWEKHVLDALTLAPLLGDLAAGASVADVGSGGGLPGIPLAVARPDLKVTLIEATQKKSAFLSAVAGVLGLENVSVRPARAEELGARELRGAFDAVTARAVGRLAVLVPLTAPLARAGGLILLVKGQRADEELAEATHVLARARCVHVKTVATPTGRIVVLRKDAGDGRSPSSSGRRWRH
jgi:16S rRNA (guanine527-N7)-methyltransferase